MSKLFVDEIVHQSSQGSGTITLGASGETVALASGASQTMAVNTPAFEAYISSNQTITYNTDTLLQFDTEKFDTDSAYDNSTNYRFTVPSGGAGKYFVYSQCFIQAPNSSTFRDCRLSLKLNNVTYKRCYWYFNNNPIRWIIPNITATLDLSVGDYLDVYLFTQTTDSTNVTATGNATQPECNFGAYKIIGA